MCREDSYNVLLQKKQEYSEQLQEKKKSEGTITLLRAITFIAGFCLIAIGISDENSLWTFGVAFLVGFILLVRKHNKLDVELCKLQAKVDTSDKLINRFEEKWNSCADNGSEFLKSDDYFAKDVDLLGDNSLYQKISLCSTAKGKAMLTHLFSLSEEDFSDRDKRQEAIAELIDDIDFAVEFSAATSLLNNKKAKSETVDEFAKYCGDKEVGVLPSWANLVRTILPVAFIVSALLWMFDVTHYGYALFIFVINLSFTILTRHITDNIIQPLYLMCIMLEKYMDVLSLVNEKQFKSAKLIKLSQSLCGKGGAYQAFGQLKGISQAYNISYNPVMHQVLSAIFLWDYQLAYTVGKWKNKYGENISGCFDSIGELETLLSLASIGMVHDYCWGEIIEDEKVSLTVKDAFHPLLKQDNVVSNSAGIEHGITIITGSNMSGKTTFLRTLAINLVLAYIGAPVCAKELKSSRMKIFTSMRVTDDVANGISTFYAEILRIKTMSEYKKSGLPMLCLIDEIFKGTNSADRIVGAKGVITGLSADNTMVIVSTHDFELCSLTTEDGNQVTNYHFEEYYENEQLKFDYKIKNGRCTTTNAKEILKMAGFNVIF